MIAFTFLGSSSYGVDRTHAAIHRSAADARHVTARLSVCGPVLAARRELLAAYGRRTERQQDMMTYDLAAILDLVCGPRPA